MNAGPAGFRGAPVSKVLVLATVTSSIILQTASKAARRRSAPPPPLRSLAHVFAFRHPGELLFGALLTYYFRLLERQMGSAKYSAYALIVAAIAHALEAALASVLHRPSTSGLYPLIFANMVAFFLEVPPLQRFSLFGTGLSDKAFVYLAALQLLFSCAQKSVAAGLCGGIAGVMYHLEFFGLRQLRLPKVVENVFATVSARLTGGTTARQQIFVTPRHQPQDQQQQQQLGGGDAYARRGAATVEASPEAVQQLVDMGFDAGRAREALQYANNNVELALQALL